jgi:16S rRNA C1402 (ribose-2'-O) methylase RsmI
VLLETPYRLVPLLEAAAQIMPNRRAYIGCNLTMPFETHHYGTFKELYNLFKNTKFKGEFVICFDGSPIQELGEETLYETILETKPQKKESRRFSFSDKKKFARESSFPKKEKSKNRSRKKK